MLITPLLLVGPCFLLCPCSSYTVVHFVIVNPLYLSTFFFYVSRFVTGDWGAGGGETGHGARTGDMDLGGGDGDEIVYGDFEDLQTGRVRFY